jgi:cell division protein FtsL
MALASRQYYYDDYDEYQRGVSRRTPPLNAATLVAERRGYKVYETQGGYAYMSAPDRVPAQPIIKPYIVPDAPDAPKKSPRKRRSEGAENVRRFRYAYISAREKAFIFAVVLVCGAAFMALILLASYHASVQNEVNVTKAQAASVQEDIDALKVSIEKGNTIDAIESHAIKELGMTYPGAKQIVYLGDISEAAGDQG